MPHSFRRRWIAALGSVFFVFAVTAAAQFPYQNHEEMYEQHLTRVNDQSWVSGQMPTKELATLKERGFKAIINLRLPKEHDLTAEKAEAERLGLRYFSIPVDYEKPREEQVTEYLRLADDPKNQPTFLHCTMAIRAGAFWMVRRVLREKWSLADAEAEARKIGANDRYVRFARDYISHHPNPPAQP
jgi:protein tyrosine phosphatase (PTP) superfamily phosphohydrolase (DUF442 family)